MSDIKYCEECVYWGEIENETGECRIKAPEVMDISDEEGNDEPTTVWPQTEATDWCGQSKTVWLRNKYVHGPQKGKS